MKQAITNAIDVIIQEIQDGTTIFRMADLYNFYQNPNSKDLVFASLCSRLKNIAVACSDRTEDFKQECFEHICFLLDDNHQQIVRENYHNFFIPANRNTESKVGVSKEKCDPNEIYCKFFTPVNRNSESKVGVSKQEGNRIKSNGETHYTNLLL